MADQECTFDHIDNFRDVGRTINEYLGRKLMQEGKLYRSARPDDASLEDRRKLTEDLGIKTVMDLRTKTEHATAARQRKADIKIPVLLQSNAALAKPVQLPGLNYLEIRLSGRRFEIFLIRQLAWLSLFKFLFFFLFGFRTRAIRILAREVMAPRGLVNLQMDTIDQCGPEILEALESLIEPGALPMLVHCTQGKDRTGLVVALVLLLLSVPVDAVTYDYSLSKLDDEQREVYLRQIKLYELPEAWVDPQMEMCVELKEYLDGKYGGVERYMDRIEFINTQRNRLRELLWA